MERKSADPLQQAVKVVIRTRPTSNFAFKNMEINTDTQEIACHVPRSTEDGLVNNQQESWKFKFDKIMHNISQEEVFEQCGREVVANTVEGYNGTIMCYGQTGAGKTFTMSGSP